MTKKLNNEDFYKEFSTSQVYKKYIFGINEFSDYIANKFSIDGYIDEYTKNISHNGKPVYKLNQIDKNSLVISSVTQARIKTSLLKIKDAGIINFIDYFSFSDLSNGDIPQHPCILETRLDFKNNKPDYDWVRSIFSDQESTDTFDKIMNFRLNARIESLKEFNYRINDQYFEAFLNLQAGEVFVDVGGFDGFTTCEFVKRCPSYSAVHFFEPNERNLSLANQNISSFKNINVHKMGLFDKKTTLSFDPEKGSASKISESGIEIINVDLLDDVVSEKTTFIKLDIEGVEMAALRGMKNHILKFHPKIAIAVYHKPSDFREIPTYILGIRNDYNVYLRHYTEGWTETIMYFIPKK